MPLATTSDLHLHEVVGVTSSTGRPHLPAEDGCLSAEQHVGQRAVRLRRAGFAWVFCMYLSKLIRVCVTFEAGQKGRRRSDKT